MVLRRILLAVCAFAAGCGGMGIETLALASLGLPVGYGRATAWGLGAWVCAWSLGAFVAGRWVRRPARAALGFGLAAAALGSALLPTLVALGAGALAHGSAATLAVAAVALTAFCLGGLLPLCARAWQHPASAQLLFGCALAGAALGAFTFGDALAAQVGRTWSAAGGAACVAAASLGLAWLARGLAPQPRAAAHTLVRDAPWSLRAAFVWVALSTACALALEWIALRLAVLWLGGMQPALTNVLVASLATWTLGAWLLPPLVPRDRRALPLLLVLAAGGVAWPFCASEFLSVELARSAPLIAALVLVGPCLFSFGAWLPVLFRGLAGSAESGALFGRLLCAEALGAPLAIFAFDAALGAVGGLRGALLVLLGVLLAAALVAGASWRARLVSALPIALVFALGWRATAPALATPPLSNPAFTRLAFEEDKHFAVTVVDDGVRAERTLLTDDFRATGTGDDYVYMRVLGHLPLVLSAAPRRVAVLAFGTGTTAGAVSLHPEVEQLDVLELSEAVLRQADFFEEVNQGVLRDTSGRVRVRLGDGRRVLAQSPRAYDVITMEPLLPDSPFAVYLYTREFYRVAQRALAPGGLLCQWVPPHALHPDTFAAVVDAFVTSFGWSAAFVFGTQVILIGAESEPPLPVRAVAQDTPLAGALAQLGLDRPAGIVGRCVAQGAALASAGRPLTDADPWIVYRKPASGREVLGYLGRNLAQLRRAPAPESAAWDLALDAEERRRAQGIELLLAAREVWEWERARLQGAALEPSELADLDDLVLEARALAPGEPELARFERTRRFHTQREAGVAHLRQGDARAALALLLEATQLRPERADMHAFVAAAAQELGQEELARKAFQRALAACPGLLETPQGRVALTLGLDPGRLGAPN